jgi:cytochrome c oxidase subunit 2
MVVLTRTRALIAAAAACLALVAGVLAAASQQDDRRVILVIAERFSFTPSEIVVEAGEEVEIRLRSSDTAHGFRIAGTNINVTLPKRGRGEASVVFRSDSPGRYEFECSRLCGAGHDFMRGVLVVRPREEGLEQ